jgi:hypothetical protein
VLPGLAVEAAEPASVSGGRGEEEGGREERERDPVGPARQSNKEVNPRARAVLSGDVFWKIRFHIWKAYFLSTVAKIRFLLQKT